MAVQPTQEPEEPFLRVDVQQAREMLATGEVDLVDVREPDEWARGHLPGARHVPLNELIRNPRKYLQRDNVLFVCAVGQRSAVACEVAASIGLQRIYNLEGGTVAWARSGLPLEQ